MQENILYISFYDFPNQTHKRVSSLAAVSQVDYVSNVLLDIGLKVKIVSPSWYDDSASSAKYTTTKTTIIKEKLQIVFGPSFGTKNKFIGYLKILFSLFWLFFFLVKQAKKNEKILVYHSPWLALPILLAKKIKKFQLILDVEEIYSDVSSLHPYFDKLEQKIIQNADSYLFSTEFLAKKLNPTKPYAVFYGNYKVFPKLAEPLNDGKIHVVYAGIIDSEKLGAFNAIETALFLDENYQIHIIGFGEVEVLQNRIKEINAQSKCKIVFDGQKFSDDYIRYCQMCHIGLSTQKMEGNFVETSFPSKILSYLGMGLQVVSGYVSVVAKSKIANNVVFYTIDSPESIAQAIKNTSFTSSSIDKMKELDDNFKSGLTQILLQK
jgi:hypothetical protein